MCAAGGAPRLDCVGRTGHGWEAKRDTGRRTRARVMRWGKNRIPKAARRNGASSAGTRQDQVHRSGCDVVAAGNACRDRLDRVGQPRDAAAALVSCGIDSGRDYSKGGGGGGGGRAEPRRHVGSVPEGGLDRQAGRRERRLRLCGKGNRMPVYGISESGQGWAGIVPIGWRGRAAWRGRGFVGSGPSFSAVLVDTGLGTWWPWFRSLGMGMDDGGSCRFLRMGIVEDGR